MAQQTALEWLVDQISSIDIGSGMKMRIVIPKEFITKAKQIEYDRRKEDFNIGYNQGYLDAKLNKYITMAKQQTAVEWLIEQYANENYGIEVYEQAKQMEKEQIIIAHGEKSRFGFDSSGNYFSNKKTGEQYFKETYGK